MSEDSKKESKDSAKEPKAPTFKGRVLVALGRHRGGPFDGKAAGPRVIGESAIHLRRDPETKQPVPVEVDWDQLSGSDRATLLRELDRGVVTITGA